MRTAILIAVVLFSAAGDRARGDDWMFHPSAYSHSPRWGHDVGVNRFSRGPYYSPQYGAYFRSGYRHLNSTLGGRGWTRDRTNVFESWFQTGEQFVF